MKSLLDLSFMELCERLQSCSAISRTEANARAIAIRGLIERAVEMYREAIESRTPPAVVSGQRRGLELTRIPHQVS